MIKRIQLTRYMADYLPRHISQYDKNYFEFETIKTGLSSCICTYGYRDVIKVDDKTQKCGEWLPIIEVKKLMKEMSIE